MHGTTTNGSSDRAMALKDSAAHAEQLRLAALDLIVAQAHRRQALSPICAGLLCAALWPVSEVSRLLIWLAVLLLISIWRHFYARSYLRAGSAQRRQPHWEWHFFLSLFVASAAWGIGAWLVMPSNSPAHQALVFTFAVGMVGGSAVLYGVHRLSAMLALPMILLPSAIYLCSFGDRFHIILASGGLLLLLAANMGSKLMFETMRRTIELTAELDRQARLDTLSGLHNRRAFAEFGEQCIAADAPFALIMLDVDHFKAINDRHGHAAGDRVIEALGALLARFVCADQCAARIGGEEFALLLPGTDLTQARDCVQKLLTQVRQLQIRHGDRPLHCTVSIGYTVATATARPSLDRLLMQADTALYAAKRRGRDRAMAYTPGMSPGPPSLAQSRAVA